jgi:hypothetical protein
VSSRGRRHRCAGARGPRNRFSGTSELKCKRRRMICSAVRQLMLRHFLTKLGGLSVQRQVALSPDLGQPSMPNLSAKCITSVSRCSPQGLEPSRVSSQIRDRRLQFYCAPRRWPTAPIWVSDVSSLNLAAPHWRRHFFGSWRLSSAHNVWWHGTPTAESGTKFLKMMLVGTPCLKRGWHPGALANYSPR